MSEFLWQSFHRLIADLDAPYHRYLFDNFPLEQRLTGVVGARGVGKTTLLLQLIKEKLYKAGSAFYFSADNAYFSETSMLSFVDELYRVRNIRHFFIDEIHMYPNWNQELKNIYDSFPDVKVVFSGSSSIDLVEGAYDLSRRAHLLQLPGLSFREYLSIKTGKTFSTFTLDDIVNSHQLISAELSVVNLILQHFEEYRLYGYYPIVFEGRDTLYSSLATVIEKTIYEDVANFYNLKTSSLNHFKRIISFLASIPPGKVTANNLSNRLGVDNKTIDHYLRILYRTGLLEMLYPVAHGNQVLSKPEKVYLKNTTLHAAMNTFLSDDLDLGVQRELVFFQSLSGAGLKTFYPEKGDFQVGKKIFEVGGTNKTGSQLKDFNGEKFLVKDGLLTGYGNEIPLYLFGFLY